MNELVENTSSNIVPKKLQPNDVVDIMKMVSSMIGPHGGGQFMFGGLETMFGNITKPIPKHIPAKITYDPEITFAYHGETGYSRGHEGIMITAFVVHKDHGTVHYGASFCSPEDIYNKAKGKEIAGEDLISNMNTIAYKIKSNEGIMAGIFCDIIACGDYPSWAKEIVIQKAGLYLMRSILPKPKNLKTKKKEKVNEKK